MIRELLCVLPTTGQQYCMTWRSRKLIEVTITPDGEIDTRKPMPVAPLH